MQTRDFVYVEDVARAVLAALRSRVTGVFNIGTGKPTRIIDLAKEILRLLGRGEDEVVFTEPRLGDVRHSYADISRAREILGWEPKVGLREGLKKTVEYYLSIQ